MIQNEKLFSNFFDDKAITPDRFINFSQTALNNLINANTTGQFDTIIALITPLINAAANEVGDVDTSLNVQKGTTLTNDQVLSSFIATMSEQEPFIASALGGRDTPEYLQFYPRKISEYSQATKTQMQTLTKRINTAATANAIALGATLTTLLQGFEKSWTDSRDKQQQQIGDVKGNRTQRSDAITAAQLGMVTAVHTIAGMFPGNVQQCATFFTFSLLYTQSKQKHKLFTGILAADETKVVLNRTLKDSMSMLAHNPDDNAPWCIYLGATATTQPPENPIIIQPGDSKEIKPKELGDMSNTFLLIKSLSDVNDGSYLVDITGIKGDEK